MISGASSRFDATEFQETWDAKRTEFVLAYPTIFPRQEYFYFNLNNFREYWKTLSLEERTQFNFKYFQYFSDAEKVEIFEVMGGKAQPELFQKLEAIEQEEGRKIALKGLFSFCYFKDVFFIDTYLLWQNYAHPMTKDRWTQYFSIDIQVELFQTDQSIMISGLFDHYIKLESVEEQDQFFKKVFSFCFDANGFNPEIFNKFTAVAHPVEKCRWTNFCPKVKTEQGRATVTSPPPGFEGFIPGFSSLSLSVNRDNPWANQPIHDGVPQDQEQQLKEGAKYGHIRF